MESDSPGAAHLIDVRRLRAWMGDHLEVEARNLTVTRIAGGLSNEMFAVTVGPDRWILRRPPRTPTAGSAHNMAREFRILSALDATAIPHPRATALCEDPDVLGVPFLIMSEVKGFTPKVPLPAPFDRSDAARRRLGLSLADTLATIAGADWEAAGLVGFGKPDGFLERQVDRWLSHYRQFETRPIPHLNQVSEWLRANRPPSGSPAIVHGDYQLVNVICANDSGRVVAVVDWELATIGDPLLDLGWMLSRWPNPGELPGPSTIAMRWEGMPTRREMATRYAELSGRDITEIDYYMVLALFKLACLLEGSYYKALKGTSDHSSHERFGELVVAVIDRARLISEHRRFFVRDHAGTPTWST